MAKIFVVIVSLMIIDGIVAMPQQIVAKTRVYGVERTNRLECIELGHSYENSLYEVSFITIVN